jgi:hypothetical protein
MLVDSPVLNVVVNNTWGRGLIFISLCKEFGGGVIWYEICLYFDICVLVLLIKVCGSCAFFLMLHTCSFRAFQEAVQTIKLFFISRHVGDCINSAMCNCCMSLCFLFKPVCHCNWPECNITYSPAQYYILLSTFFWSVSTFFHVYNLASVDTSISYFMLPLHQG